MSVRKFRAYHKQQERMFPVYGISRDYICEDTFDGVDEGTNAFRGDDLKGVEVMQFTGLKDKNGKEIFEGDVVTLKSYNFSFMNNHKFVVRYDSEYMAFRFFDLGNGKGYDKVGFYDFEIIGNTFENEELLNN